MNIRFKIKLIFFILLPLFTQCTSNKKPNLTIAAASNFKFTIEEIIDLFEQETGIQVDLITGNSGKITSQIENKAPYDIFFSANTKYPDYLYQKGYTTAAPEIYAKGVLVIWSMQKIHSIDSIIENSDKIALANPKNAPYGQAAIDFLQHESLCKRSKFIFAESILQVNQYVLNQAVKLGFTSKSAVLSDKLKGKGYWIEIDSSKHQAIEQAMVGIANRKNKKEINTFLAFMKRPEVLQILQKYGYIIAYSD